MSVVETEGATAAAGATGAVEGAAAAGGEAETQAASEATAAAGATGAVEGQDGEGTAAASSETTLSPTVQELVGLLPEDQRGPLAPVVAKLNGDVQRIVTKMTNDPELSAARGLWDDWKTAQGQIKIFDTLYKHFAPQGLDHPAFKAAAASSETNEVDEIKALIEELDDPTDPLQRAQKVSLQRELRHIEAEAKNAESAKAREAEDAQRTAAEQATANEAAFNTGLEAVKAANKHIASDSFWQAVKFSFQGSDDSITNDAQGIADTVGLLERAVSERLKELGVQSALIPAVASGGAGATQTKEPERFDSFKAVAQWEREHGAPAARA